MAESLFDALPPSWRAVLDDTIQHPQCQQLAAFLATEYAADHPIYPALTDVFRAFQVTPFEQVRVVLLGQDPYHGANQAHGLSFSVPNGVPTPPSLRNIVRELASDLALSPVQSTDLTPWARQGVLLLNATLTVRAGQAGSHQRQGWEYFTDQVIAQVNALREDVVFILWGNYALQKASLIDEQRHCVIRAVHPSPLSAHRGFFGHRPFSNTNHFLQQRGHAPIDWTLDQQQSLL